MEARTRAIFRQAMREIGRKGRKIGGKCSLETMTPEERTARAKKASAAAAKKRTAERLEREKKSEETVVRAPKPGAPTTRPMPCPSCCPNGAYDGLSLVRSKLADGMTFGTAGEGSFRPGGGSDPSTTLADVRAESMRACLHRASCPHFAGKKVPWEVPHEIRLECTRSKNTLAGPVELLARN
jgi:hypothetical protein